MKAVILAGGYGTRISEESGIRPKPMVEIGNMPILWHILKIYSSYGINDFVIACGYKSQVIKEFFTNYALYRSDVTFDVGKHTMEMHKNGAEPWKVTLVETGEDTQTGGRLRKVMPYVGNETFCATYGDGLAHLNINRLIDFHKRQNVLATVTAVQPPGRFGAMTIENEAKVTHFREKPRGDGGWINGGFFVLEPTAIDYVTSDDMDWSKEPMQKLAQEGKLAAYIHEGFWQPLDTLRDKMVLEKMWQKGDAPWKIWK